MSPRVAVLVVVALVLAPVAPRASDGDVGPGVDPWIPRDWLVIEPVDGRGRRPFNPDAVVATHVLGPGARPPVEGLSLVGERGEPGTWTARQANENGRLAGRHGAAATTVHAEQELVVLAELSGASRLWVDDVPHHGDVYGAGFGAVPIRLRQGANTLLVSGIRGGFRLQLRRPEAGILLPPTDDTRPQLGAGEPIDAWAGVLVVNATDRWQTVPVTAGDGFVLERHESTVTLPPLGTTKLALPLRGVDGRPPPEGLTDLVCLVRCGATTRSLPLAVVDPATTHTRTFRSAMDGSAQKYSVVPPTPGGDGERLSPEEQHLVLSLHGAGVDSPNQAGSYHAKPDVWIFAATNRRPFGFDWQDWGRRDAYEVLEQGLALSGVPRSRVVLTGHSMGGHGTWHLGANDADGFAALGPSAGWIGFDTYGGRPDGSRRALWHGADGASLTLDLLDNLVPKPIYILHGENDDNVPASEGQRMHELLTAAGASPRMHIEPGKGHWWGNADPPREGGADCLDWPEMFDLFRASTIEEDPDELAFITVDPGVDSRHHWVEILQPLEYGKPSRMEVVRADGVVTISTDNVRSFRATSSQPVREWVVDGARHETGEATSVVVAGGRAVPLPVRDPSGRSRLGWIHPDDGAGDERHGRKGPSSCGPFKRVFERGFLLVVGTAGDERDDRAALDVARHHAQTWWYRGNGRARVLTDADFLALPFAEHEEHNVVLYGSPETNAAWSSVVGTDDPVDVARGRVSLGGVTWPGDDLAVLAVRPRADVGGDAPPLVGLVAGSGPAGLRLAATVPVFVSGVGLPDVTVFGPDVLREGDDGVLAAGWFDHAWRLRPGGF